MVGIFREHPSATSPKDVYTSQLNRTITELDDLLFQERWKMNSEIFRNGLLRFHP